MIKVSGRTDAKKLAVVLYRSLEGSEEGQVVAQAIGAGAVNQLVKGVAIARGLTAPKGYSIVIEPSFAEIEAETGTLSGMRLIVKAS